MNTHIHSLARQNFASVYSLALFLKSRGYWTTDRSIEQDAVKVVWDILEVLVWADRRLDTRECKLIEAILLEDEELGGHLDQIISEHGLNRSKDLEVPGCLAAAALHDSVHQTRFVDLFINHLENLGLLIIVSDGRMEPDEMEEFRAYFAWLRSRVAPAHDDESILISPTRL